MKRRLLPDYVSAFRDRHGKERYRFRRKGFATRYINALLGTEEFRIQYRACLDGGCVPAEPEPRARPGTVDDLVTRFYRSSTWNASTDKARNHDRRIIERFRAEHGTKMVANLKFEHLDAIFAAKAATHPTAAQKLRKQLRRLMGYAVKIDMIPKNPVVETEPVKVRSAGYHTWTEEEIARYETRHPLGTKARLALALMLWTAARRGDAIRLGRQHIKDGWLSYRQEKTGKEMKLPVAQQLAQAIIAMPPSGHLTFLVTEYGKPFTRDGFGNWFRDRCLEAKVPGCTPHGLRKAISRRMAEIGQSNQSIKSVTGHSGDSEVALYTAKADQALMAGSTMAALSAWEMSNRADELDNNAGQGTESVA